MVDLTDSTPSALTRLGVATVGVTFGFVAVWLCQKNLSRPHWLEAWFFWVPITVLLITLAALCWWFALRGDRTKSRFAIRASWLGGILVGTLSFALGFIGPLIVWPHKNLGPLLGILITGPLGFVGGVLGALAFRKLRASP
jgi:hypothetical protein